MLTIRRDDAQYHVLCEAWIFFGPRPGTVWCQPVLPTADANLDVLDVDVGGCVSLKPLQDILWAKGLGPISVHQRVSVPA